MALQVARRGRWYWKSGLEWPDRDRPALAGKWTPRWAGWRRLSWDPGVRGRDMGGIRVGRHSARIEVRWASTLSTLKTRTRPCGRARAGRKGCGACAALHMFGERASGWLGRRSHPYLRRDLPSGFVPRQSITRALCYFNYKQQAARDDKIRRVTREVPAALPDGGVRAGSPLRQRRRRAASSPWPMPRRRCGSACLPGSSPPL